MAAAKKEAVTYSQLATEISRRVFRPIYLLMGEESFYIDDLEQKIVTGALSEDERDFNLTVCYGVDVDAREVINMCKRYPVMAERQVVVVREAQNIKDADIFKFYAEKPQQSTILVLCNKNGNMKAPEFIKQLKGGNTGVVFESVKLKDAMVAKVIADYAGDRRCNIDSKSAAMMADYVGTDVSHLVNEMDKLIMLVGEGGRITPEVIERNIGISKDYNNFELEDAIKFRKVEKAFRIIDYFTKNPRKNPSVVTVSLLFNYFSTLLLALTAKDKSERGIMAQIDTKSPYRVKMVMEGAKNYNTAQCVNIIGYIREFDRKSKGMDSRQGEYVLLRELIAKILYC